MDLYRQLLTTLKSILEKQGDIHWSKWIETDINDWIENKSTAHHLRAFGGMGSLNDFVLRDSKNIYSSWDNELLFILTSLTYHYAKNQSFDSYKFDSIQESNNISDWRCLNCGHGRIGKAAIETFISKKYIPTVLQELIHGNQEFEIEERLNNLREDNKIKELREEIYKSVFNNEFELTENGDWPWICPKCNSKDTCAYRWTIDNEYQIIPTKDNLKLKKR